MQSSFFVCCAAAGGEESAGAAKAAGWPAVAVYHAGGGVQLRAVQRRLPLSQSRPLSAHFRPAWFIVADFDTFIHRELCRFPLFNYRVFVVVAGRLRVLFS